MKFFISYLKSKFKIILLFLLFFAVFTVSFALYKLPLKAVIYPVFLCLFLSVIFIIIDFLKEREKHNKLSEIQNMTAAMIFDFPEFEGVADEDYRKIIESLQDEISSIETATSSKYRDMVEYYTIWVHQIKTPISSMRLNLQNEDTPLSRKLSSDLFRIEQYVEMVLAFLRLDSTSSDYVFKKYNIDDIIRQSVKKFSSEFINRKIALSYEPINETIITDDKWLSFVIEQILSNALKYTREGVIKIYMQNKTLCVEDTGIGIAPDDLPRIFEKGYTGYNGRSDKKASGIGLYLCKQICKNLGAEITVSSEVGKGTVVRINLEQYELKTE